MPNKLIGTRWYKCDLHLHTPASLCFKDRDTVTPEQWVQEAIDKDLHCVAVTDHNTAEWVDKIKDAAKNTTLTVFPGVEITCSDSKVHLLILFDTNYSTQDVEDFLLQAKIARKDFGEQTAHTNLNLEDIANLANDKGALIIPAHIDEFAGLCDVAPKIAKDFYGLSMINAVQVVHKDFTLPVGKLYDNQRPELLINLNRYYGLKEIDIESKKWKFTDERMKNARRVVLDAINEKLEELEGKLNAIPPKSEKKSSKKVEPEDEEAKVSLEEFEALKETIDEMQTKLDQLDTKVLSPEKKKKRQEKK